MRRASRLCSPKCARRWRRSGDARCARRGRRSRTRQAVQGTPRPLAGAQERARVAHRRELAEESAQRVEACGGTRVQSACASLRRALEVEELLSECPVPRRRAVQAAARFRPSEARRPTAQSKPRVVPHDLTLPGHRRPLGSIHPVTQVQREIEDIFLGLGFSIETGPEIESVYYNFDALNIPESHPARDDWDTLYVDRPDRVAHPHVAGADSRHGKVRRAALHHHARASAIATTIRIPRTRRCSTRSKAWPSTRTSPSRT